MRSVQFWVVAITLSIGLSGCSKFRKAPATPPAPAATQPSIQPPVSPTPQAKPMEEPQLPGAPLPPPEIEPQVIRPKIDQVEPPKPKEPSRRRARNSRTTPAVKTVKPVETPPAAPPEQAPTEQVPAPPATQPTKPEIKLAEVLSEEQRRDYSQTIDESLGEARRALGSLQGRTLTREQSENESRVRTFIRQAEEARESDIRAAAQFSRRAALLARELLETLKK
ncbi:hypothetical protein [uncultured Paludibaculum sp.]|uniref:hypothetical protein n=1 Tax=uncultured Paludibaculum sp. TaxID=1765020 RepID=UPI002AAC4061|nr:hypothetical protein [uncultured Paludibaculum sp.]